MRQHIVRSTAMMMLFATVACRDDSWHKLSRRDVESSRPSAEFVISAGDSAYWVTSGRSGMQWKGAPLDLARVDGRFFEIYVVDDDESFQGADLVGQNVYRRDLQSGDSVLVYRDSLVPRLAEEYARSHPRDQRLEPGEDADVRPAWRATATLDLGAAHGRFMSFTLHTDVERDASPLWHTTRRGVIDLRGNGVASLADVVGMESPAVERQRDRALQDAMDSVRSAVGIRGARANAQLAHYRLDPTSFAITTVAGEPAIAYALPGSGGANAGHMLPLGPIRFAEPAWWRAIAGSLPTSSADGTRAVWRHGNYDVVVRLDTTGAARLSLRDSTSREWAVGQIASPATRVYWLDHPAVDSVTRHALVRAFQDASGYGEETRVASSPRREWLEPVGRPVSSEFFQLDCGHAALHGRPGQSHAAACAAYRRGHRSRVSTLGRGTRGARPHRAGRAS